MAQVTLELDEAKKIKEMLYEGLIAEDCYAGTGPVTEETCMHCQMDKWHSFMVDKVNEAEGNPHKKVRNVTERHC